MGLALLLALSGAVAGGRAPVRTDAQIVDVRPHGGDHRRTHNQPAGTARRGTELGLPLRLGTRRRVLHPRPFAAWIPRRGDCIYELLDSVRYPRRDPDWTPPGYVWNRRSDRPGRARAASPRGLPGVNPGAGGERSGAPITT